MYWKNFWEECLYDFWENCYISIRDNHVNLFFTADTKKNLQLNRWWCDKSKTSPVPEIHIYFENQFPKKTIKVKGGTIENIDLF